MSDSVTIDGVKVTHTGGGYYELEHESLTETGKVRGKDEAEAKAKEIAAEAARSASMPAQGQIPSTGGDQKPSDEETAAKQKASDEEIAAKQKASDDEIAALKAELAAHSKRVQELEAAGEKIATVVQSEESEKPAIPAEVPREYAGTMSDKSKKALNKLGIRMRTIILEENENIPPTGLFLSHNFRGYVISPGEKVDVPEFLVEVLDNAVMSAPIVDSKSSRVLGYRDRLRYPYRRMD